MGSKSTRTTQAPGRRASPSARAPAPPPWPRLLEQARDIVLLVRAADGRILQANAAAGRAYGCSPAELRTLAWGDLHAASAAPEPPAAGERLYETWHQRRDGARFPVEIGLSPADGEGAAEVLAIIRDLSGRPQAGPPAAEERFQQIAELIVDYAFVVRFKAGGGLALEWEAGQVAAVPHYTFRAVTTLAQWETLVHPDDRQAMRQHHHHLAAGEIMDFVVRVFAADGTLRWLQHYGRPRREAGRVVGFVAAVRDVTAQQQTAAALRASEERYRLVSDLSSDYAFANRIAPDGTVTREWVTSTFTRLTGYSPEAVVTAAQWQQLIHPADWPAAVEMFRRAVAGDEAAVEFRFRTAAGAERWLSLSSRGWRDPASGVIHTVGAVRDITAQRQADQALRAYAQRLEILHDLSRSILAAQAADEIAATALRHLDLLIPAAAAAIYTRAGPAEPLTLLVGQAFGLAPLLAGLEAEAPSGLVELPPAAAPDGEPQPRSLLRVPMRAAGQSLGLLLMADPAPAKFSAQDLEVAEEVMGEVAIALHQRRLQEAEKRRRFELEALARVTAALRQAPSSAGVQRVLIEQLMAVVQAEAAALFILEDQWRTAAVAGPVVLHLGQNLPPDLAEGLPRRIRGDTAAPPWEQATDLALGLLGCLNPTLRGGVAVHLWAADRLPAVVVMGWPGPHPVTASEGSLLAAVAEIGSNALERSSLLETLERRVAERTRELTSLYEVAAVANQAGPAPARLERALSLTLRAVGAEAGAVYQAAEDGQGLGLLAHCGPAPAMTAHLGRLPAQESLTERVFQTGRPLILNDLVGGRPVPPEMQAWADVNWRYIGLPLRSQGQVLGVLGVVGRSETHLSAESMSLLGTIADQLGALLEAERLRRQAEKAAIAEERQRLARDLHDSVTQSLYSALLFTAAAHEHLDLGVPERSRVFLGRIDAIISQALREMRLLIYELRPALLASLGLVPALQHRLEAVEGHANIKAQLQVDGDCQVPPALEEALYAVAQEALNNALKHAGARAVRVGLRGAAGRVTLTVEDDGAGFDPATAGARAGAGLDNMRERLARCGGQLQIESQPGRGCRLVAEVSR